jgi:hypothetical protein
MIFFLVIRFRKGEANQLGWCPDTERARVHVSKKNEEEKYDYLFY